ncbi:MAG: hypothetical protein IJY50_07560 [Clostridia bacterium]|nr:hypothetical protein [Clostridia bacterium]
MFGYIKTLRAELRVREYEYYRASYCGLCRAMGKCTGQCSRLTLSYDFAFLVNVRMALTGICPTFQKRFCLVHPFHKRMMMERNEALDFAANASAILAHEKCRDDLADERGMRKWKARMRYFVTKNAYKRAKKRYPELADGVRGHLERLREKEQEKLPSVDAAAAIFGDLLADIVSHGLEGTAAGLARSIGWQTGRFIYIVDAIDDLEQDAEKGRFNPFLLLYGGALTDGQKQDIYDALIACLSDLEKAFDLIDDPSDRDRGGILKNILYLGMPQTVKTVLWGGVPTELQQGGDR